MFSIFSDIFLENDGCFSRKSVFFPIFYYFMPLNIFRAESFLDIRKSAMYNVEKSMQIR